MIVQRPTTRTLICPSDWGTGEIYIDEIAVPELPSRFQCNSCHFAPGARTAWHSHPMGQTLYVLEGLGIVQSLGEPPSLVYPGDRVVFRPDEEHWHGAAPDRFMAHLSMNEIDAEDVGVRWSESVGEDEYRAASTECFATKEER